MSTRSSRPAVLRAVAALALIVGLSIFAGQDAIATGGPTSLELAASRTYVVNSTADRPDADVGTSACSDSHHRCTLRAAIMQANFHVGADIIKLPHGTFKLTRKGIDDADILGDLDITDSLTIKGAGSSKTIVDGNGAVTLDRVFEVFDSAKDVTFSGLTIRNGKVAGTFGEGGGLSWQGSGSRLSLSSVVVEHNKASYDGGISLRYSTSGDVVDLNKVTIRNNTATAAAGGLGVVLGDFATFSLRNGRIYGNKAYEGGGLYLDGGHAPDDAASIRIDRMAIYANHASLSGGIENRAGSATVPLVLTDSDIHDDTAVVYGGGIGNYGVLAASSTTIAANSADSKGGAIYGYAGSHTTLTNVTVSGNKAKDYGGGIYGEVFLASFATVTLTNGTMSGNSAATGGGIYADAGAQTFVDDTMIAHGSSGTNCSPSLGGTWDLSDDASCGFGAGDSVADLKLGPLGAHGGRTRTQVPKPGSPALDAGSSSGTPPTDQRGIPRPQGAAVDVGAVEVCPLKPAAPSLSSPGSTTVKVRRVTLDWKDVGCVQSYNIIVRHGSRTGTVVQTATGLLSSAFRTKTLHHGWTYYWQVRAVGDRGSTTSSWRHFHVH